jgi:hypothetical protein
MRAPMNGEKKFETKKPTAIAPAVVPRDQPNSSRIDGKRREKAVRALTTSAMVTKAVPTMTQP